MLQLFLPLGDFVICFNNNRILHELYCSIEKSLHIFFQNTRFLGVSSISKLLFQLLRVRAT